jgi:hypothetical protein
MMSKNFESRIYKTIILPVILYGCETWSLILREEHRLRVFENRVLRRLFGPRRDEVTEGWRKLHNQALYKLYSSASIIRMVKSRRMKWPGHVPRMARYDIKLVNNIKDHLCGLVVRVLGYRSGGPGSIPGITRKKSSGSGTGFTQLREYN